MSSTRDPLKEFHHLLKSLSKKTLGQARVYDYNADSFESFIVEVEPKRGHYKHGRFLFQIRVGRYYPREPPDVICLSDMYHPNIDTDNVDNHNICLNLFDEWNRTFGLEEVIQGLLFLFYHPNLDDPISSLFSSDITEESFKANVRKFLRGEVVDGYTFSRNAGWEEYERIKTAKKAAVASTDLSTEDPSAPGEAEIDRPADDEPVCDLLNSSNKPHKLKEPPQFSLLNTEGLGWEEVPDQLAASGDENPPQLGQEVAPDLIDDEELHPRWWGVPQSSPLVSSFSSLTLSESAAVTGGMALALMTQEAPDTLDGLEDLSTVVVTEDEEEHDVVPLGVVDPSELCHQTFAARFSYTSTRSSSLQSLHSGRADYTTTDETYNTDDSFSSSDCDDYEDEDDEADDDEDDDENNICIGLENNWAARVEDQIVIDNNHVYFKGSRHLFHSINRVQIPTTLSPSQGCIISSTSGTVISLVPLRTSASSTWEVALHSPFSALALTSRLLGWFRQLTARVSPCNAGSALDAGRQMSVCLVWLSLEVFVRVEARLQIQLSWPSILQVGEARISRRALRWFR